jgi:hypothetical protein
MDTYSLVQHEMPSFAIPSLSKAACGPFLRLVLLKLERLSIIFLHHDV